MDTYQFRLIVILLLFYPLLGYSVPNPDCPWEDVPQQIDASVTYTYSGYSSPQGYCTANYGSTWIAVQRSTDWGCQNPTNSNDIRQGSNNGIPSYTCPVGYTLSPPKCNLTDIGSVACTTVNPCTKGTYFGMGRLFVNKLDYVQTGSACFNGCKLYTKQTLAIWGLNQESPSENLVPLVGDFFSTGELCQDSVDGTLNKYNETTNPQGPSEPAKNPSELPNPKINCITDANGSNVCLDRQKPGCGFVNDKAFCADDILQKPGVGLCTFVGSSGYICADPPKPENPTNPPPIVGEPPPVQDGELMIPVKGPDGQPLHGILPGTVGIGSQEVALGKYGHYPGPSGNGTGDNNQADEDKSPGKITSCQSHPNSIGCQNTEDYWSRFAKLSGGQGVVDAIASVKADLNKGPEEGLGTQEVTGDFSPESVAGDSSCPAPKSFTAGGRSFELSYEPVCDLASGVRPVFLAIMGLFAAYIVLGSTNKSSI